MVDSYRFEVFGESSSSPRLRWFDTAGVVAERVLDKAAIDAFVDEIEVGYRAAGADLVGLGGRLYRWLDGPTERWLGAARSRQRPMVVNIDCRVDRLRHLPWELLHDGGFLSVHAAEPMTPVRFASTRVSDPVSVANRALRVLFMAASPLDVEPVLDFEREEQIILEAAAGQVEVVVEESGSLTGLASLLAWFGDDYFDVVHLSGHGLIGPAGPRFVAEDDEGRRADVSAEQISEAVGGRWPAMVFISGCSTAGASGAGEVMSMAEALVAEGAPVVLGWALPVGDQDASELARSLYGSLAIGADPCDAVPVARRALYSGNSRYWHLLRMFADHGPLGPLVTAPGTRNRPKFRARPIDQLFFDPSGKVKVAPLAGFVGRRRELQRGLRALRPANPATGPQALVVHGMGGLGKSTLVARLLDRMATTHPQRAVWVGPLDEIEMAKLPNLINGLTAEQQVEIGRLLSLPDLSLEQRLRQVLDQPNALGDNACVFVFDDFEDGNLVPDGAGRYICTPETLAIVTAFAQAIAQTASPSRVVITSRYTFPLPAGVEVMREPLMELRGADLDKKLALTTHLGPTSTLDRDLIAHAVASAAGVPRLIEGIDRVIGDPGTDAAQLLAAFDTAAVEYREGLFLQRLLDDQTPEVRRLLALAAIYEIPVPLEAILGLEPDLLPDALTRAVEVGLLEAGIHPASNETRYLVSNLVKPLLVDIDEGLNEDEQHAAWAQGTRLLYDRWASNG